MTKTRTRPTGDRCPLVQCRARLEFTTDRLIGRTLVRCRQCERRKAGICRDCPAPVEGTVGKAYRCAPCKERARITDGRRNQARHREERNARARLWSKRPEALAKKAAAKRAWAAKNPEKIKAYRRQYVLKQTPGYVAGYRRANADPVRAEKKREQARARYWQTHAAPSPVCRTCGVAIPFDGGRPRVTCGGYGKCLRVGAHRSTTTTHTQAAA
jgi:hypothetical protein